MTRYIEWGERRGTPSGATHYGFGGSCDVDPTDLSTVTALWAALPTDLRLALAKTAPRVAGKWMLYAPGAYVRRWAYRSVGFVAHSVGMWRWHAGGLWTHAPTLASAQSACDAALLAQGYVLEGDTP